MQDHTSGRRTWARLRGLCAATFVLALLATGCAATEDNAARRGIEGEIESRTEGTFYRAPSPLPAAAPGTIIRSERVLGAPIGMRGWRVLYHSRDVHGNDIAASAIVVAPDGARDEGRRPIVGWGHPTTGAAPRCAPSVGPDPYDVIEGLRDLVRAGYVVAAADYPGMGTAAPQSYMIGSSEGRSVLDAARAARNLPETGAGDRLLLWGHSQGGQAVLFAGQEAASYAPELDLRAVAVAAPAAELGALLDADIGDVSGVSLGSYAFSAYQAVYGPTNPGMALDQILTPAGVAATPKMAKLCLFGQNKALHAIARPLVGRYLRADPAKVEPWASLLEENTPGGAPIHVPLFVAQGGADKLVEPASTAAYVARLCRRGETVHARVYPKMTHATIALRAMPEVMATFRAALAGTKPTDTC